MAKKYQTSPKAKLQWAYLVTPDTKFDSDGVFKTDLVCSPKDPKAKALIAEIEEGIKGAVADAKKEVAGMKPKNGKKPVAKVCEDKPYSRDDEGNIVFRFKMKAKGKKKDGTPFTQKPALFDSMAKPITDESIKIGAGTTAIISFEIVPFFQVKTGAGVSLRMKAVQIVELVEFGGDGKYFGFEEHEGGFGASSEDDDDDEETDETEEASEFEAEDEEAEDNEEETSEEETEEEDDEEEEEPAPKPAKGKKAAPAAAKKKSAKKSAGKNKPAADDDDEDF